MRQIDLNRQLMGVEDFLFGVGKVIQTRGGHPVEITKINAGNLPFDETQSLLEFAQSVNLYELGQIVEQLAAIGNNIIPILNVNNNEVNINTVAGLNTELISIYANLASILNVNNNEININKVAAIDTSIDTLADNIIILNSLYDNLTAIQTNSDNITAIVGVYNNISSLNSIVSDIIPNLAEILLVDDLAIQVANDRADVAAMKLAVETIYDTFDDRFLGSKLVDPTVDNDGNALIDGALYYNSSSNVLKVYDLDTTTWITIPQLYLSGLLDVILTSINTGDILTWNGSKWVNTRTPKFDSVQLNGGASTEGILSWNSTEGTADLTLPGGSVLQIGQEDVRTVRNSTASTIVNGTLVMFDGTIGNSGRIKVKPFTGGFNEAHLLYGVTTQNIGAGLDGIINIAGKVRDINTTGSQYGETWEDGDILYAKPGDAGALTKVIPSDNQLKLRVAAVVHSHISGTLEIRFIPFNENIYYTKTQSDSTFAPLNNPKFTNHISLGNTTLSTWSSLKVIEATSGVFFGSNGISALTGSNCYYDGNWRYKVDGSAGLQLVNQGSHQYRVAPTGLAGSLITWETVADLNTTGFNAKSGTLDLPGFGFLGDLDTGIYNPAANELGLVVGGSRKVHIKSTGAELDSTPAPGDNSNKIATTAFVGDINTRLDTHMSVPTAYHIYNGGVSINNTVITNGFATKLYTGNGSTQTIVNDVDMSSQWGNDVSETYGGLVWRKARSSAQGNQLSDTVRGATVVLGSESTSAQSTVANSLTAFNNNGFSIGSWIGDNQNGTTYVSWAFQTTHRKTTTSNHGKTIVEHYNPYTGFTIIKYTGSGLAGHEIPHSLNRKLGFVTVKNLTSAIRWQSFTESHYMYLNETTAGTSTSNITLLLNDNSSILGSANNENNTSANDYIMYGWANSYYDKNNTLIGNYEVGIYQGTGVSGNKITTRGKPAWVMVKRIDSTGSWAIHDNLRGSPKTLYANAFSVEDISAYSFILNIDGFTLTATGSDENASGGQYLYMVVYDNDSGSGKSKYPKATDMTNVNINALVPYANGIDTAGSKVSISYKHQTINGLTLTQGKNYIYSKNDGTYGSSKYMPMYGALRDRVIAGENPNYFDLSKQKWFSTSGGDELVTNGTFATNTTGWTSGSGITWENGQAKLSYVSDTYTTQDIAVQIGKPLIISVSYNLTVASGGNLKIYLEENGINVSVTGLITTVSTGVHIIKYVPNSTTIKIKLGIGGSASTIAYIDNVTCFELTPTIGAEITPRTYLDCIVYADQNGQPEYVEELAKTVYFDEVKSNEFKGKNACTAWALIDGTGVVPIIKDGQNMLGVVKTTTGVFKLFPKGLENINYGVSVTRQDADSSQTTTASCVVAGSGAVSKSLASFTIGLRVSSGSTYDQLSDGIFLVEVMGGKN